MSKRVRGIDEFEKQLNDLLGRTIDLLGDRVEGQADKITREMEAAVMAKINGWMGGEIKKIFGKESSGIAGINWPELAESTKRRKARQKKSKKVGQGSALKNRFWVNKGNLRSRLTSSKEWGLIFSGGFGINERYTEQVSLVGTKKDSIGRTLSYANGTFVYKGQVYSGRIKASLRKELEGITIQLKFFKALEILGFFQETDMLNREQMLADQVKAFMGEEVEGKLSDRNILRRPFLDQVVQRVFRNQIVREIDSIAKRYK